MAKDRKKLLHIHSSITGKQPTPTAIEVGEIAVNNAANNEFLSIKNSNNKVVKFSSDGQMIDWVEKKEVIPYSGTVDNVHLDTNRSNIEIKLNQVVAKNTVKYNVVNGAKDIDGQDVNPSSDGGITNGAGFAIDMSRYAMIGANPSFSSITVSHKSNLSGTTNISNGAGGSVLKITTTNVDATDTNWAETITNKTSKVTTLAESATTATLSGNSLAITESSTTINSCGKVEITTDNFKLNQCNTGGTAEFEFCGGYTVKSNNIKLQQCGTAGTITLSAQTENITGGNLNITESGNTNITTTGSTNITATQNICESAGATAAIVGATKTNVGKNCADGGQTTTLNLNGTTINETGTTVNINGSTTTNISGGTVNVKSTGSTNVTAGDDFCVDATDSARVYGKGSTYLGVNCAGTAGSATTVEGTTLTISGNTTNITGATTLNVTGTTINVDASTYDLDAATVCVSGSTKANFYGKETNIGVDCGGTTATTINVSGATINEGGTTNNNNFTTINNTATTINNKTTNFNVTGTTYISGDTTISGATTIGNTLIIKEGLEKSLSWSYGDVRNAGADSTNFKADKSFVIPNSVKNMTNWNGSCYEFDGPLCITGTVTASGAIYSSDKNLKENIKLINYEDLDKVALIEEKSFNFKDDTEKRKTYGVIAQEVQAAGLNELVHVREDGYLGVDYTSYLILKVARLTQDNNALTALAVNLDQRVRELENKLNNKD